MAVIYVDRMRLGKMKYLRSPVIGWIAILLSIVSFTRTVPVGMNVAFLLTQLAVVICSVVIGNYIYAWFKHSED